MSTEDRVNILLVDDEPSNLIALEAILQILDQNIIKASSGKEALRYLLDQDFAAILLDVQMAGMNGIETAAMIRDRERSRRIPIIFLTGTVKTNEMMFKGYSAGAVDYLVKPIDPGVLRAKLEVFIELALARQKLQQEIAERVRAAAEITKLNTVLEQKNADLTAANSDLEAFSYSVSHDLRSPLRHIAGFSQLLDASARGKLDEKERKHLETIKDSATLMGELIDALLTFARINRVEMSEKLVNMDGLVQETLSRLQTDLKNRRITWDIKPLPEVPGDRNLLRQVWTNLLENAVKYTRPCDLARIEISAVIQEKEAVFQVRDNGVGFDMRYADKLFGVFQRLHTQDQFEGTGIGLANVRRVVQRHGGRIWAQSKEGEGSIFNFALPLRQS